MATVRRGRILGLFGRQGTGEAAVGLPLAALAGSQQFGLSLGRAECSANNRGERLHRAMCPASIIGYFLSPSLKPSETVNTINPTSPIRQALLQNNKAPPQTPSTL